MTDYFGEGFGRHVYDGQEIRAEHAGFEIVARLVRDEDMGPPWKEHDGHGPVTEWERRDPKPWEWVVASDRGARRFYDHSAALVLATKDGWGASTPRRDDETPREYRKRAVREDYEAMRAWCNDEWQWYGVTVTVYRDGVALGEASVYLTETASDLVAEAIANAKGKLQELAEFSRTL